MKGAWAKVFEEPSVRFVLGGTVFLAFGSLLLAFGSLRTVQNVVGFTTWEMATQTAIAGGLGMILVGLVYHLFPRIIGRALYNAGWAARQFWFTTVGLATVVVSMAVAGLIQGYLQIAAVQTEQPISTGEGWHAIALAVRPLFILRIAGGTLVALGLFVFIRNLVNTVVNGRDIEIELPVAAEPEPEPVGASA
jgi:cbb3-type cytochrome oxidase subunit 1